MRSQPSAVDVVGPVWRCHLITNGPGGGVGTSVGVGLGWTVALGNEDGPELADATGPVPGEAAAPEVGIGALEQAPSTAATPTTAVQNLKPRDCVRPPTATTPHSCALRASVLRGLVQV